MESTPFFAKSLMLLIRYQHLGDMMSLGSRKAAVALPFGLPEAISQSPVKPLLDMVGIKLVRSSSNKAWLSLPDIVAPLYQPYTPLLTFVSEPDNLCRMSPKLTFCVQGDSSSERVTVQGPFAGVLRRVTYWYRQPTNEHRARVGASWVQKGLSDASKWIKDSEKS